MTFLPKVKDIRWVGCVDWSVRSFHGYTTEQGTTYNSYLINDIQPVLVDTVKKPFFNEFVSRITQHIALDTIRYIVILHAEPDHSSALPLIYPYLSSATIVCTDKCRKFLLKLYPTLEHAKFQVADARFELKIGQRVLKFIITPMLHWPEQMMCYCQQDQVLFSSDAFGQHYASSERFADQIDVMQAQYMQKEYLANILGPFQQQISNVLQIMNNLRIKYVLPAHGLCFRGVDQQHQLTLSQFTEVYQQYAAEQHVRKKILIIYDTMYGSAARAAQAFSEGVKAAGYMVSILDLKVNSLTKVAAEAYDCCGLCLLSATFSAHPMPHIYRAINYLSGLQLLRNKQATCICSYGWGSIHSKMLELLERCKCDVQRDTLDFVLKPTTERLSDIFEYGKLFSEKCLFD